MKKHNNAQNELRDLFNLARDLGKCHTQKDFAYLIGLNPANLSSFLNGAAPITEQMMQRIKAAAQTAGVARDVNIQSATADGAQVVIEKPQTELIAEMRAQREMYQEHTRMYFEQIKQLSQAVTALANRS